LRGLLQELTDEKSKAIALMAAEQIALNNTDLREANGDVLRMIVDYAWSDLERQCVEDDRRLRVE